MVCIEETYLVFYLESGPITTQMVLVCPQMYYFILYKKLKGSVCLSEECDNFANPLLTPLLALFYS